MRVGKPAKEFNILKAECRAIQGEEFSEAIWSPMHYALFMTAEQRFDPRRADIRHGALEPATALEQTSSAGQLEANVRERYAATFKSS